MELLLACYVLTLVEEVYSHGWGCSPYSVKTGYDHLLNIGHASSSSRMCGGIWNPNCLPKINAFCRTLVHKDILNIDIFLKHGIQSP